MLLSHVTTSAKGLTARHVNRHLVAPAKRDIGLCQGGYILVPIFKVWLVVLQVDSIGVHDIHRECK